MTLFWFGVSESETMPDGFMYLQQEKPAELIFVSVIPMDDKAFVTVSGMGALQGQKLFTMSIDRYQNHQNLLTSKEMEKFRIVPVGDESVTGLDVYTVSFHSNNSKQES